MEIKKHRRRGGNGRQMEECLFYRKQYGSKVCMTDGTMDAGSDGPMCTSVRVVKEYRNKKTRVGLRCTGEK